MPRNNALTVHNYFCNLYKRRFGEEYNHSAKGIELSLIKRMMDKYDIYQLMYIMDKMVNDSVTSTIKNIYDNIDEWIMEYAYDPLIAKARFAIRNKKGKPEDIKQALYDYTDELDAWFPVKSRIEKAAMALQEVLKFLD